MVYGFFDTIFGTDCYFEMNQFRVLEIGFGSPGVFFILISEELFELKYRLAGCAPGSGIFTEETFDGSGREEAFKIFPDNSSKTITRHLNSDSLQIHLAVARSPTPG